MIHLRFTRDTFKPMRGLTDRDKLEPGLFEAIARVKEELDINVELASPDDFIPSLPGWRERSLHIARHGDVEFLHYDSYAQALSKLQRAHERDLRDVRDLWRSGLIEPRGPA